MSANLCQTFCSAAVLCFLCHLFISLIFWVTFDALHCFEISFAYLSSVKLVQFVESQLGVVFARWFLINTVWARFRSLKIHHAGMCVQQKRESVLQTFKQMFESLSTQCTAVVEVLATIRSTCSQKQDQSCVPNPCSQEDELEPGLERNQ